MYKCMLISMHACAYQPTEPEPVAYVKLGDNHYSVVESETFEVCVSAVNHGSNNITFTVWIHIEGD